MMEENDTYIIHSNNEIDFQLLLNDYIENFTRKRCILNVSDKKVQNVEIRFSKDNLPHLLGWHKVTNKRAPKILAAILEGNFTHSSIINHHNYKYIKDRLYSYNFLHKCFIHKDINYCIVIKSNLNNSLDLDIVFIDYYYNKTIVLGLRRVRDFYIPTTMYVMKDDTDQYNTQQRSKINSIDWHTY